MPHIGPLKSSEAPAGVVQFRADANFMAQLQVVAQRLQTSPGLLSKQWVAERLANEILKDHRAIEEWLVHRSREITKKLKTECESGPVQILHLIPLSQMTALRTTVLEPAAIRAFKSSLAPVERVEDRYSGRINELGYYTEKRFANNPNEINGYVQVFRHGQVESVRVLRTIENQLAVYGSRIDDDLIRSIWFYSSVLRELAVPLPIQIFLQFRGLKGYEIKARSDEPPAVIDTNELMLEPATITEWSQIATPAETALNMRSQINTFWQASGYDRSPTFSSSGAWTGPLDPWG